MKPSISKEININYLVKARHRGQDPLLFLDMRAGRRYVLKNSKDLSVLNLFSYTCGIGLCAVKGEAKEVWNIDFAKSSLEIGQENAQINQITGENFKLIKEDVFGALYQMAGIPFKGRLAKRKPEVKLKEKNFDLVFLDPPPWSKGHFGTVDLIRDYQSIFKPALMVTAPGGRIIAVNNVGQVNLNDWIEILKRCAIKAGKPIKEIEIIQPEDDFPSWDKNHPLKIAVCQL